MINIIHQTSKDNNLKDFQIESKNSILKYNPGFKYMFWTDDDLEKIVKENFQDLYQIWGDLKGIQKSDLGRYAVLYLYGGFYADTDAFCKSKFHVKDENKLNLAPSIKVFPWSKMTATNYFMYSYKSNDSFIRLIQESIKRIKNGFTDVPYTTGRVLILETLKFQTDYVIYDDSDVFNKFCYNSEIPENCFIFHDGSTSREGDESWVDNYKLKVVKGECYLKKSLGMNERKTQFPILLVIGFIIFIILFIYIIFFMKKK